MIPRVRGWGGVERSKVRTRPGHLMKDLLKSLDYFLKTIRLHTWEDIIKFQFQKLHSDTV